MKTLGVSLGLAVAGVVAAQDLEWVRDWEQAQRERPANVTSVGRIAPTSEPGLPLVVHGRVVRGAQPLASVMVFAYQTDRGGEYNARGKRGWRLRGWARTDAHGRFELRTIRPGSYPGTRNPAHIHFSVEGPGVARQWVDDVQFADDPFADQRRPFVRPVRVRDGVQHVEFVIDVNDSGRF
jgi:protocatechuate 3,4-dioxygenase beta subunit